MNTRDKLELMKDMAARNEARRKAYLETAGVHQMIETYAKAILDSLDIAAQRYDASRSELLELLMNTAWAMDQTRSQEG